MNNKISIGVAYLCFFVLGLNAILIEILYLDSFLEKNIIRILVGIIFVLHVALVQKAIDPLPLICAIALLTLSLISQNPDQLSLIYVLIIVQSTANIELHKIINMLFVISIIILAIVFILLALGITSNEIQAFRERSTYGLNGVGGPTLFYNLLFSFLALGTIAIHGPYEKYFRIFSILCAIYFYLTTDTRGGALSFLFFMIFIYTLPLLLRIKPVCLLIKLTPIILLSLTLLAMLSYDDYFFNTLLSNRPYLYYILLSNTTLLEFIFGASVKQYDLTSIVDNSYLHILIGGGLLVFISWSISFYKSMSLLISKMDIKLIAFLLATSLYLFVESLAVRIENLFIILYWLILIRHLMRATYVAKFHFWRKERKLYPTHRTGGAI